MRAPTSKEKSAGSGNARGLGGGRVWRFCTTRAPGRRGGWVFSFWGGGLEPESNPNSDLISGKFLGGGGGRSTVCTKQEFAAGWRGRRGVRVGFERGVGWVAF